MGCLILEVKVATYTRDACLELSFFFKRVARGRLVVRSLSSRALRGEGLSRISSLTGEAV